MEKVFCGKCANIGNIYNDVYDESERCRIGIKEKYVYTSFECVISEDWNDTQLCILKNKNNDCKDFRPAPEMSRYE